MSPEKGAIHKCNTINLNLLVTGSKWVCHLISPQTQSIAKSLLIISSSVLAQFVQRVGANISPRLGKNNSSSGMEFGLFACAIAQINTV